MSYKRIISTLLLSMACLGLHAMTAQDRSKVFFKDLASYVSKKCNSSAVLAEEELLKKFQLDGDSRKFVKAALEDTYKGDRGSYPIVHDEIQDCWWYAGKVLDVDSLVAKVITRSLAKKFYLQDLDINPALMDPGMDDKIASFDRLAAHACGNNFTTQYACFDLTAIYNRKVLEKFKGLSIEALEGFLKSSEMIVWDCRPSHFGTIKQYIRNIIQIPHTSLRGDYSGNYSLFIVYGANKNAPLALMQFKSPQGRDGEYSCNIFIKNAVKEPLRQQVLMSLLAQSCNLFWKSRRGGHDVAFSITFSGESKDGYVHDFFEVCSSAKPLQKAGESYFTLEWGYHALPQLLTDETIKSLLPPPPSRSYTCLKFLRNASWLAVALLGFLKYARPWIPSIPYVGKYGEKVGSPSLGVIGAVTGVGLACCAGMWATGTYKKKTRER